MKQFFKLSFILEHVLKQAVNVKLLIGCTLSLAKQLKVGLAGW